MFGKKKNRSYDISFQDYVNSLLDELNENKKVIFELQCEITNLENKLKLKEKKISNLEDKVKNDKLFPDFPNFSYTYKPVPADSDEKVKEG